MYHVHSGELRKNVPDQHAHHVRRDHVARPVEQAPVEIGADATRRFGAVRQPNSRVERGRQHHQRRSRTPDKPARATSTGSNGRTSGHGGVAQDSAQVQNRNAGSTDRPKTRVSTTTSDRTVQSTRPVRGRERATGVRLRRYHRTVALQPVVKVTTAFGRRCIPADCVAPLWPISPSRLPPPRTNAWRGPRLARGAPRRPRCSP